MTEALIRKIERTIHYRFKDKSLLEKAFTHSSFANQKGGESNERLEFLGDAILDFVVAEELFSNSSLKEGQMSKCRANVVSSASLSKVIEGLKIERFILLGGSFSKQDIPNSIKENLFEALVGAIYIDSSMDKAKRFILRFLEISPSKTKDVDYKTRLQEVVQAVKGASLVYFTYNNPKDETVFCAEVYVNDIFVARGTAQNKKQAQILCAKLALSNKAKLELALKKQIEKE